jgi:hypothetical protein
MKTLHSLSGKEVKVKAPMYKESYYKQEVRYAFGGVFGPLSKWIHEGFGEQADVIHAKSKPENMRRHELLGLAYRVPMLEASECGAQGSIGGVRQTADVQQQQLLDALQQISKSAVADESASASSGAALQLAKAAPNDADSGASSPDDNSSSSSSSSGKKTRRSARRRKLRRRRSRQKQTENEAEGAGREAR